MGVIVGWRVWQRRRWRDYARRESLSLLRARRILARLPVPGLCWRL